MGQKLENTLQKKVKACLVQMTGSVKSKYLIKLIIHLFTVAVLYSLKYCTNVYYF